MLYNLLVFREDIPVSISAVKHDRYFVQAVSNAICNALVGVMFTIKFYDNGIVIDSPNLSDTFLGTTIPFIYMSRKIELRVFPHTFS